MIKRSSALKRMKKKLDVAEKIAGDKEWQEIRRDANEKMKKKKKKDDD